MFESYTLDNISILNNPIIKEPGYAKKGINKEDEIVTKFANDLQLVKHPNGGYFKETDRPKELNGKGNRSASSLIHFLMTCESPIGKFHTNLTSRTIHILQRGRGVYVLIYPNGEIKKFTVGFDAKNGEVNQWVVPAGVYKGCYLVSDNNQIEESSRDFLWVSEAVVPGFDFADMKGLNEDELKTLVGDEKASELSWLL